MGRAGAPACSQPTEKEKRRVLRDLSELTLIDFDFDE